MKKITCKFMLLPALTAALLLGGCQNEAPAPEEAIVVDIVSAEAGELALQGTFIGTVSSGEDVSVIPMVAGQITNVYVKVGDEVKSGQKLAQIDDKSARMQLESANAAYQTAQASAAQTTGASWDMQTMTAANNIEQIKDAIAAYQKQIEDANDAIDELNDKIDDLEDEKADLEDESDELSENAATAAEAAETSRTKYFAALAIRSQMEAAGITSSSELTVLAAAAAQQMALDPLSQLDPKSAAALAITQAMPGQGVTAADLTDSGIALLKSASETADAASGTVSGYAASAASGAASIDAAIEQCRSGIKQYESAIDQCETAITTYEKNLKLAEESAALTNGDLKQQTQDVLDAQLSAARVGVSSAATALEYYSLKTPIDGVVTAVSVERYGMAATGYAAFVISNQNAMTVTFNVSQAVRDELKVGQNVTAELEGQTFAGAITEIANAAAAYSGLFPIKATVGDARGKLMAGTSVTLTTATYTSEFDSLLVPYDAVYYDDNQAYVFCAENGVAVRHNVTVGLYDEETASITGGLLPGAQVIASWSPRLREGAAVRAANMADTDSDSSSDVNDSSDDSDDSDDSDGTDDGSADKTDTAKTDTAKTDTAKTDTAKTDAAQTQDAK